MLIAIIAVIVIPVSLWAYLLYQVIRSKRRPSEEPLPPIALDSPVAQIAAVFRSISSRMSARWGDKGGTPVPLEGSQNGDTAVVVEQRTIWDVLRFVSGPLPLSIALHVAILLAILWSVHFEQGRNLITVNFQTGGGGGGTQELKPLNLPEMPMPEMAAPMPIERPIVTQHSTAAISEATHYVRSVASSAGSGAAGSTSRW